MQNGRLRPLVVAVIALAAMGFSASKAMSGSVDTTSAVAMARLVQISNAMAIYINPDASITNATNPAVGKVGKSGGNFNCTGTILSNRLSLANPQGFVVTAGHCAYPFQGTPYSDTEGKFQINGGGTTLTSNQIRRYPDWVQNGGTQILGLDGLRFGIVGMAASLVSMVVVTLMTPAPDEETQRMVDETRIPTGKTILAAGH